MALRLYCAFSKGAVVPGGAGVGKGLDCASLQGALSSWRILTSLPAVDELDKTSSKLRSTVDQCVIYCVYICLYIS